MTVEPFPTREDPERPEVQTIREAFQNAEAALDDAVSRAAALLASAAATRASLGLSSAHGMSAERQIAEALVHLTEAKGRLLDAHASTQKSAHRAGLTVAAGPVDKPKDDRPIHGYPTRG